MSINILKVKEAAKSLIYLCEQIEVHQHMMDEKIEKNKSVPESYPEDEIQMHVRYIDGYKSNIEKVVENVL